MRKVFLRLAGIVLSKTYIKFGLVGLMMFVLSFTLMFLFVDKLELEKNISYLVSTLFSYQVNFVLNDNFTWRDRKKLVPKLRDRFLMFIGVKISAILLNQILFFLLTFATVEHHIAQFLCAGALMAYNFISGERWIYRR